MIHQLWFFFGQGESGERQSVEPLQRMPEGSAAETLQQAPWWLEDLCSPSEPQEMDARQKNARRGSLRHSVV